MNGFQQPMKRLPETDEEAKTYLAHPFTVEYQQKYDELRKQGVGIVTALQAVLEMRASQLEAEKAKLEKWYPHLAEGGAN